MGDTPSNYRKRYRSNRKAAVRSDKLPEKQLQIELKNLEKPKLDLFKSVDD
jgi:hypothetical protein